MASSSYDCVIATESLAGHCPLSVMGRLICSLLALVAAAVVGATITCAATACVCIVGCSCIILLCVAVD